MWLEFSTVTEGSSLDNKVEVFIATSSLPSEKETVSDVTLLLIISSDSVDGLDGSGNMSFSFLAVVGEYSLGRANGGALLTRERNCSVGIVASSLLSKDETVLDVTLFLIISSDSVDGLGGTGNRSEI